MSVDYHVYLGPYLQCEYVMAEGEQFRVTCSNPECRLCGMPYGDDLLFCSVCGHPLITIAKVVEKPNVNCWELAEEIDEVLMPVPLEYIKLDDPFHIWIPNIKRNQPRKFRYNPHCDSCIVSLGDKSHDLAEILWFEKEFMEEIRVLKKHYKECLGQWGLIIYSS